MKTLPLLLTATVLALDAIAAGQTPRATPSPNWPFPQRSAPSPAQRPGTAVTAAQSATPALTSAHLATLATERAKLIEGVKTIPRLGAPGSVVAYGANAFPLVTSTDGNATEAIAAAASMGKGRAVIFGHTGYLAGDSAEGDLGKLLLNSVRWCGRKEKPRVGLKGSKSETLLKNEGIQAATFRKIDKKTLSDFEVIIVSAQDLTDEAEAKALAEYIENGGGVIGGVTGWAFEQTSGGKKFEIAHRGNDVLASAGLAWTDDTIRGNSLDVPAESSPMLNAFTAIAALQSKPGAPAPEPAAIETGAKTIQLALSSMPAASKPAFQKLLSTVLVNAEAAPVPTPEKPLSESEDAAQRARASLDARLSRFLSAADIKSHPAADKFPGRVTSQARAITKTASIDPKVPGWHSTGLYADAGAKITVKLPPEFVGQGYSVRIGCHSDGIYHLDKWKRMPEITSTAPLNGAETLVANAFGGLVYITVPDKAKQSAPFNVTIAGAVEAPLFVLGQTTDAQWQQMRQLQAPWAELACKGVILSLPADVAREITKPTELMQFWQAVVDAEDELSGVAAERRRPERIVPDVQISAGFMHSGYPIMVHLPQAKDMIKYGPDEWPGWGFYHEIGHNHQSSAWTFAGTGEVTCNLFALYILETVHKQPITSGHGAVKAETQEKKRGMHLRSGAPFEKWKSDPFLALGTYIQLIEAFGFDPLKKVLRSYKNNEFGPQPKSDDEKRDQWMVRYSKIVGKNLGPFFDAWGIPVSSSAKAEIANLPMWMPEKMKF